MPWREGNLERVRGDTERERNVGGGGKRKKNAYKKKLDNIPKEISGLGQTAHTLSKITV